MRDLLLVQDIEDHPLPRIGSGNFQRVAERDASDIDLIVEVERPRMVGADVLLLLAGLREHQGLGIAGYRQGRQQGGEIAEAFAIIEVLAPLLERPIEERYRIRCRSRGIGDGGQVVLVTSDGDAWQRQDHEQRHTVQAMRMPPVAHQAGGASIWAMRRAWRPPSNGVSSQMLTISSASGVGTSRAPMAMALASLCARPSRAVSVLKQ